MTGDPTWRIKHRPNATQKPLQSLVRRWRFTGRSVQVFWRLYQEALAIEFQKRSIDAIEQLPLSIMYKGQVLRTAYRPDFVVSRDIIVEIKALDVLTGRERAQVLNYLRAAHFGRGILINFGASSLQYERLVWNWQRSSSASESA